jgi:hypothetical protein
MDLAGVIAGGHVGCKRLWLGIPARLGAYWGYEHDLSRPVIRLWDDTHHGAA